MKKFKLALGVIIIAFFGLFFYQNKDFFMASHSLSLKLPFMQTVRLPELPNAIVTLAFLFLGLLIAYFFSLLERFKANKIIKGLNATVDSNLETIAKLKGELAALQSSTSTNSNKSDDVQERTEQKV